MLSSNTKVLSDGRSLQVHIRTVEFVQDGWLCHRIDSVVYQLDGQEISRAQAIGLVAN